MKLDSRFLSRVGDLKATEGTFNATLDTHGRYNTFQYVLRLSPAIHRKLAEIGSGIHSSREALVQKTFDTFCATTLTYDLTDQWISRPGPFTYGYGWLSQTAKPEILKTFADQHFSQVFGVQPDDVEIM